MQLLLSKKAILVEGATEYLLLPKFYEKKTGRTVENDGISIISCNGISYKRYLEIAEETGKRIAVITDNDHEQTKIDDANEFNQHNEKQHVFMGATMEDWTWEACIYNCNKEKLHNMIQVQDGANTFSTEPIMDKYWARCLIIKWIPRIRCLFLKKISLFLDMLRRQSNG